MDNDWTVAELKTFLNDEYYNRTGYTAAFGLKDSARKLIDDALFYLGGGKYDSSIGFGSADNIYQWERGNTPCGSCKYVDKQIYYNDLTKLTWTGKIGLLYPSDVFMVYANGVDTICYDDPTRCFIDGGGTTEDSGMPSTGWIYNSNIRDNSSSIFKTWLLSPRSDSFDKAFVQRNDGKLEIDLNGMETYVYQWNPYNPNSYSIRPVVYLIPDVKIIGGDGSEGNPYILGLNNEFKSYSRGQIVRYDNQEYYVLSNSLGYKNYVELLKKLPLNTSEINSYNNDYISSDGEYPYFENSSCTSDNNKSNCNTNYDTSSVKEIIDKWSSGYSDDLVNIKGYETRLITKNELIRKFGFEQYNENTSTVYKASSDTPDWIYLNGINYWSMTTIEDSNSLVYGVGNILSENYVFNKIYIRPIIYLKKTALDDY